MKQRSKQVHLVLALQEFRNINLTSKGCYKIKVEAFTHAKFMNIDYFSNQDLQEQKPQLNKNYSTTVQYHSDEQKTSHRTIKSSDAQFGAKGSYFTLPFFVKYHCEKVKLKSIAFFTQVTAEDSVEIRLTLWKKDTKLADSEHFQPLESVQFSITSNEHFLCQKDILIPSPQCCSIKVIILNCPLISYEEIHQTGLYHVKQAKIKKAHRQQLLLEQIRKLIKKQRYSAFVLRKQLCDTLKASLSQSIKLPLHFVQKSNMSMDEVQTDELRFFKYLAFYQKYYTSAQMLKEEIQHINFDKVTILKGFIEGFQKGMMVGGVLEEKERLAMVKKYKTYLIDNERKFGYEQMLEKYSHQEFKEKKQKIKHIDTILTSGLYVSDNVHEWGFQNQKQFKHSQKDKPTIYYPLIFRDAYYIHKQNNSLTDQITLNYLQKKTRKKKKYFIFAHGFQGLPVDLSYLINMIRFANQRVKTLVLKSYKNNMGQSIELMANRAAQEIDGFFKKVDLSQVQPEISLIGHSMGPIILRAALGQLAQYGEYFDSFISICSPHLGYIQGTKFLTQAGLSIISKLKPIQSLNQLSNRDNSDLQKTFIYKLSKQGSLKSFKRVMLIASMDDDYVPWHSARVEPFLQKGNKEKVQRQMIANIFGIGLKQTRIQSIERVQVNFPHEKQKSLNSLIGRTSHIKPLNDRGFLQILAKHLLFN